MWQYMLLHLLIVLIPIGGLHLWLAHPGRIRYGPAIVGATCGLSMLLTMLVSSQTPGAGIYDDMRFAPYIIGSLYGGIPSASILTVLYLAVRLSQVGQGVPLLVLGLFFLLFIPSLFFNIGTFQGAGRKGKLIIVLRLSLLALLFPAAITAVSFWTPLNAVRDHGYIGLLYGALCTLMAAVAVNFLENAYERAQLQIDFKKISDNYDYEVQRLQHFIEFSPLAVVLIDKEGNISHLNGLALKLLSPLTREDILQRPYRASLQGWQCDFVLEATAKVMDGEHKISDLCMIRNRLYYITVSSWGDAPNLPPEGALVIAHDITELQQLKDELNKMDRLSLVGQMAASITHEIRNPMAVIRGFVQLLNERSTSEQSSYFHIILQELDRANAIINDFLSLAQNRIVEKNVSDLHGLLEDLLPLLQADANMRGQEIELRLCDRVDPLELNVKEIKQLVLNLARNGMEAMNDKGVLRIETRNLEDTIELRVTDNGVGIPPEKLERLFEPFFTTKTNGTGLGLALCLSIVERHHGRIEVESRIGEGTTFIVSFRKPGRQLRNFA